MKTSTIVLACVFLCNSITGNPIPSFPEIHHSSHRDVRFKSVKNENYVYLRAEEQGGVTFGTKALISDTDTEVQFTLHVYSAAQLGETVVGLPVHESSHRFLRMTADKKLEVAPLDNDFPEAPESHQKADARFFHLKRAVDQAENAIVLEAMNGADSGYFLAVSGTELTLKEYTGDSNSYPSDIMFYEDDVSFNQIPT